MEKPAYTIRTESPEDVPRITELIKVTFKNAKHSDGTEHKLVQRLRQSEAFIPELSLVADLNGQIVGHILLTKVHIKNEKKEAVSLALAPVSVLPKYQQQGIGAQLIKTAHQRAIELGYSSVVLLGHEEYYPKFGYQPAHTFDITFPFDAPAENCMAVELTEGALYDVSGQVVYPDAFQLS